MDVRAAHHQCGFANLNVRAKNHATPVKMFSTRSSLHDVGYVITAASPGQRKQPKLRGAVSVMLYFTSE